MIRVAVMMVAAGFGAQEMRATDVNMAKYASRCASIAAHLKYPAGGYPVCVESLDAAIAEAKAALNGGGETYTIQINAGAYDLSYETKENHPDRKGYFNVTGVWPTKPGAVLVVEGWDPVKKSPANASFVLDNGLGSFFGKQVSGVHFDYLTVSDAKPTITQGVVEKPVEGQTGYLILDVPEGFPSPLEMWTRASARVEKERGFLGYLRAYTNAEKPFPIDVEDNIQVPWAAAPVLLSGNRWKIVFKKDSIAVPPVFSKTDAAGKYPLACLKMPGVAAGYAFFDSAERVGHDIQFNHVTWYDMARGVFRFVDNAEVNHSKILVRAAPAGSKQGYCMSVPDGGPQFSQPEDFKRGYYVKGAHVNDLYVDRSGDDSIAIFNAGVTDTSSVIENSTIAGSFARQINLFDSCSVRVPMPQDPGHPANANKISACFTFNRAVVPAYYNGCVTDTSNVTQNMGKRKGDFAASPCTDKDGKYTKVPPL